MLDPFTLSLLLLFGSGVDSQPPGRVPEAGVGYRYEESISVELVTRVVRVVDRAGWPVEDLAPRDFVVQHKRQRLPVVAVEEVETGSAAADESTVEREIDPVEKAVSSPRLIVFFVQADMHPIRVHGLLHIQPFVRNLLTALPADDYVAVTSFDSRFKVWHDFSRDREAQADAVADAVRFGKAPYLRRSRLPSLAAQMDFREAWAAATPEAALGVLADALGGLPGEKIMVYLGWGLGRRGSEGFSMTGEYPKARRALARAQTSVFVLDITHADYHTLELGLRTVAADTGGTYEKTDKYSQQAIDKLVRSISAYYVLTIDRTGLPDPLDLEIEVPGRRARVLTRGG